MPDAFRIQDHLAELRDPHVFHDMLAASGAAEPDAEDSAVELIETNLSVVCLVADRAFKFKKSVSFPFVDFQSAAQRETACHDELTLNRRMAADVYLEVVALCRTGDGLRVQPLGSDDEVVDHGVLMKRLPASRMLDRLLREGVVEAGGIRELGSQLARFHSAARPVVDDEVRAYGTADPLLEQIDANFEDCAPFSGEPPHTTFDAELLAALRWRVERRLGPLRRRLVARAARIVDGHGDLHAANICMTAPPTLYDCIEFRRDFRCADAAADVAFLAMDLRARGRRDLAVEFVSAYTVAAEDPGIRELLPELIRYRAMVRAKVDAFAAADTTREPAQRRRLESSARRHLLLCAWSLLEEGPPVVILGSGLPGSGKSTLMRALSRASSWPVLESDVIRKHLFGVAPTAKLPGGAYASTASDRVYELLIEGGLQHDGCVLLDANYRERQRREQAIVALQEAGRAPVVLRVECRDDLARERLRRRHRSTRHTSDADEAIYDRLKRIEEPPGPDEGAPVLTIDGGGRAANNLQLLARHLLEAIPDPMR